MLGEISANMLIRLWQFLGVGLLIPIIASSVDFSDPSAMDRYDEIQRLRQSASSILKESHSADSVRKAIEKLNQGLVVFNDSRTRALAEGNIYLEYRRFDLELDLAEAFALLGEPKAAMDHLENAERL